MRARAQARATRLRPCVPPRFPQARSPPAQRAPRLPVQRVPLLRFPSRACSALPAGSAARSPPARACGSADRRRWAAGSPAAMKAARRCCSNRTSLPPREWSLCTPGDHPPTPLPWGRRSARAGRRGESLRRVRSATARVGPSGTRRSRAYCTRSSCTRSRVRPWPRATAAQTPLWARGAPPEAPGSSPHPEVGSFSTGQWCRR